VFSIPQEFVVSKFYEYAGHPQFNRLANVYQGCCPICREGKSWGRKKRLYYIVKKNVVCCHNCGWFSNTFNWIKKVSNLSNLEIISQIKKFDNNIIPNLEDKPIKIENTALPEDCVNLLDTPQMEYYKKSHTIIQKAHDYISSRRLDTAINRPKAFFVSLKDRVHKNRLLIPFYDFSGNIIFYQSREILNRKNSIKYLSKIGGEKSLFNVDKIDTNLEYIFIFEGPIDSCFVKNGVALTGIQERSKEHFSNLQKTQLNQFKLHKKIWVLDSQWKDKASLNKSKILLSQGETVFIWPEELGKRFKDFNEICIAGKLDKINPNLIIKNSYSELKGKIILSKIKN